MDLTGIIKGTKPIKQKPIERFPFDKQLPLGPHNFPMSKYIRYYVTGFKRQGPAGIPRPFKVKKVVPTGVQITPEMFGLYSFISLDKVEQIY